MGPALSGYLGRPMTPKRVRTTAQYGQKLTEREKEVLLILVDGGSKAHACIALGITEQTMKNHLTAIYRKTGSHNLVGAYRYLGWLRKPTGKKAQA